MVDLSTDMYSWIKAFHIVFVITWMAGLLYLPRLFVYHTDVKVGTEQSETFKRMERKLLRGIINPSMIVVFILGGILLVNLDETTWLSGWLVVKLVLVTFLGIYHFMAVRWYKDFAKDSNKKSSLFFRWANEIPAVLMIGIVILAVVRPF